MASRAAFPPKNASLLPPSWGDWGCRCRGPGLGTCSCGFRSWRCPALTLVAWRWFCEHCSCWAGFPSFTETSISAFPPPWETSGVTLTNGVPGTLPLNSRTCRLYNSARAVPRLSPVPTPIHHMGQRGKELKVVVVGVGRGCVCVFLIVVKYI